MILVTLWCAANFCWSCSANPPPRLVCWTIGHAKLQLGVWHNSHSLQWFWSHFDVLLTSDLIVQQTHFWGWFVEQRAMISCSFGCVRTLNSHCYDSGHTVVPLTSELIVQQTHLSLLADLLVKLAWPGESYGRFVDQKLIHSSSFRCDQIYKCQRYFSHTLLCYLSRS
jgi:hypothetical protein